MGSMSASDAAPLPRLGEVFFDVRGSTRTMRVSWYSDTEVAVFSVWNGDTCTGTFRLPREDLERLIEVLGQGLSDEDGPAPRASGPPTTAMAPPGPPADEREHAPEPVHPGWSYGEPRERYEAPDGYDAGYDAPGPSRRPRTGYPPSGPLPVGRWQETEPDADHQPAQRDDRYPGYAPGYPGDDYAPAEPAAGYRADEYPGGQYQAGRYPGEPYPAGDYPDEPGGDYLPDPLSGDYHDEAEQGYLPGPPTDMFPAAPPPEPPGSGHGGDDRWQREYGHSRSRS